MLAAAAVSILVLRGAASDPADVPFNCAVHDSDASVQFALEGLVTAAEAEGGCEEIAARFSGSASYWKVGISPLPTDEPRQVCALISPDGAATATVEENPDSFATSATSICGRLAHAGWTQDESAAAGPWQREFAAAVAAQEAIELEEQEAREAEAAEREREEAVVEACGERAEAQETAELEAIERETEARLDAAASESEEYRIEEEGWSREEDAWERGEAAFEACGR